MTKRILVTSHIPEVGVDLLRKQHLVTYWQQDRPITNEELNRMTREHDALLSSSADVLNREFLEDHTHLEIISQFAVGYDNIDVDTATRLGMVIGNAPGVMTEATADVAFGLMLATSRKMFYLYRKIREGKWTHFVPQADLGLDLRGKTLGVYGLGRIGMEMARLCRAAYDMQVIYHNRNPNEKAETVLAARRVSFETLLQDSDVLSVHCALTDETQGIFNAAAFRQMKPTAIFVNTSRGGVHVEEDLIRGLEEGWIWGAGLDVTNPEPMHPENPLLQMERVCVLPHIGSATVATRAAMSRLAAENIVAFYNNEDVPHLVNPEVLNR